MVLTNKHTATAAPVIFRDLGHGNFDAYDRIHTTV